MAMLRRIFFTSLIVILMSIVLFGGWMVWQWWKIKEERALVQTVANTQNDFQESSEPEKLQEAVLFSSPVLDSDGDGLSDEEETEKGTNPQLLDTDGDGLTDRAEIRIYFSNPLLADTDKDGYRDGDEVRNFYNPAGPGRLIDIVDEIQKIEQ